MISLWSESLFISDPGQSDLLAFGRNPVRRSLGSVSSAGLVALAVRVLAVAAELFLGVGFVAGGVVRSSVANGKGIQILNNPIENQGDGSHLILLIQ